MSVRQLIRLLLVDGDGVNRYTLSKALQRIGYLVTEVPSAEAALQRFSDDDFDLVLAEIALPGKSGLQLLREIKLKSPDAVVIMLTENAAIETAIQALRLGAKDYLIKPIAREALDESVAHGIEAARSLRRRRRLLGTIQQSVAALAHEAAAVADAQAPGASDGIGESARSSPRGNVIDLGPLSLYPGTFEVSFGDASISLTPTEFDLLLYLAAHRGRVIPCQELVREVRGYHTDEAEAREVIRPHVSNLRRKVKSLGEFELVRNARALGYRLGDIADSV